MQSETRLTVGREPDAHPVGCAATLDCAHGVKRSTGGSPGSKFRPERAFGLTMAQLVENTHRGSNQTGTLFRPGSIVPRASSVPEGRAGLR
jgi:hypothetical protein